MSSMHRRVTQLVPTTLVTAAILAFLAATVGLAHAQTETVLYSFTGGSDGNAPDAPLIIDQSGNLYGTTIAGGYGTGTVFEVSPAGAETVLHRFTRSTIPNRVGDGAEPIGGMVFDAQGNLYGTTFLGGAHGFGTVFKVNPSKQSLKTALYSFTGGADGMEPASGVILDAEGNLYGTTPTNGVNGFGTVFKLTPSGTLTVLHSFPEGSGDGSSPNRLAMDAHGNLYGTTLGGGAAGQGTVFMITPSGTETVLHSFSGTDGSLPTGGLTFDAQGNLYGVTGRGGSGSCGVVFELAPSGNLTVLHSFTLADGCYPESTPVFDAQGNLYGTTGGAELGTPTEPCSS